ncbi:MAG: dihydroxyacetone kinase, partial [Parasporobacterium sp.]|nr:dihydroxyacetone kinase [Parasporobacterium sp.]
MEKITFEQIPEMFDVVGKLFIDKKDELCAMDAKLGDGDLGLTMSKGYGELPGILRAESAGAAGDIGKLLQKGGMKMHTVMKYYVG